MQLIAMLVAEAERLKEVLMVVVVQVVEEVVPVLQLILLLHPLVILEVAEELLMDLVLNPLARQVRAVQVKQEQKGVLPDLVLVPIQVEEPVEVLTDNTRRGDQLLVELVEAES